jgi:hypothetical protein
LAIATVRRFLNLPIHSIEFRARNPTSAGDLEAPIVKWGVLQNLTAFEGLRQMFNVQASNEIVIINRS